MSHRCFIPCRRHVRAFILLRWSTRKLGSMYPPRSVLTRWSKPVPRSAQIGSFVSIGAGVTVGRDCRIGAHPSLGHALLGSRVYIYPGARIGQEGFSFATTKTDGVIGVSAGDAVAAPLGMIERGPV